MGISLSVHAADMFRWIDEDGVVHFSDDQPEGDKEVKRLHLQDPEPKAEVSPQKIEAPGEQAGKSQPAPKRTPGRAFTRTQQKLDNFPIVFQKQNWCVIASMEMIFRYYGHEVDQDMIFQKLKGRKSRVKEGEGLDDRTAARFLSRSGFNIDHREGGDLDTVKKYIDNNVPVLWGHVAPGKWEGSRHMSVIIGYDDVYKTVIVADPSFGRELVIPYDDFKDWWGRARNVMIAVSKQ